MRISTYLALLATTTLATARSAAHVGKSEQYNVKTKLASRAHQRDVVQAAPVVEKRTSKYNTAKSASKVFISLLRGRMLI